jgi:hypothetical protein
VPWMGLQLAPAPHAASATFWSLMAAEGEQTSAHAFAPLGAVSAHVGVAVAPAGTSVGHAVEVQSGEQKEPSMPVTETPCSSAAQPAEEHGSPYCVAETTTSTLAAITRKIFMEKTL